MGFEIKYVGTRMNEVISSDDFKDIKEEFAWEHIVMITGGLGFIGSNFAKWFAEKYPNYLCIVYDKETYCGNLNNLLMKDNNDGTSEQLDLNNLFYVNGDICDNDFVKQLFEYFGFDWVVHFAAESHVDNSIKDPYVFAQTNVMGTLCLLENAKNTWLQRPENVYGCRFYHVSTDEVYGALGDFGKFTETTRYDPHSPYSASKASSDHFVRAYHDTYGLPILISNCSNNYGAYQYPEKLIPKVIDCIKNNKEIPVYGKGENVRDWLDVMDHARAIDVILHNGVVGETYNIGGDNEMKNIDLVKTLIKITDKLLGRAEGESNRLITYVEDRLGHDWRYAIDSTKLQTELKWKPLKEHNFEYTVQWYLDNEWWIEDLNNRYKDK